jgi:uncharacterized protein YggE
MIFVGMLLVAAIVVVALVRERIVNPDSNQVTVNGEGRVEYQPDTANITLGAQIDKAATAEEALRLLNEKMGKAIDAIKAAGIDQGDIKTKTYSLSPQYDFKNGVSTVSGYGANQQLEIKAKGIDKNPGIVSQVVSAASGAGINQVVDINFEVSNLNDLKQQAKIEAIGDARTKAGALAQAAGIKKLKKVVSWYENIIQSPDMQANDSGYGGGPTNAAMSAKAVVAPQIPSGNQEIIIDMGVVYEVE